MQTRLRSDSRWHHCRKETMTRMPHPHVTSWHHERSAMLGIDLIACLLQCRSPSVHMRMAMA
jgi:hypothetical protein